MVRGPVTQVGNLVNTNGSSGGVNRAFGGVRRVVERDSEDLPRPGNRGLEGGRVHLDVVRLVGQAGGEVADPIPLLQQGHRVGGQPALGGPSDVRGAVPADQDGTAVDDREPHQSTFCGTGVPWPSSQLTIGVRRTPRRSTSA